MKTRWVWMLAALTLAMLVGYALGQRQATDATCLCCDEVLHYGDAVPVCADCYQQQEHERAVAEARVQDLGEAELTNAPFDG